MKKKIKTYYYDYKDVARRGGLGFAIVAKSVIGDDYHVIVATANHPSYFRRLVPFEKIAVFNETEDCWEVEC